MDVRNRRGNSSTIEAHRKWGFDADPPVNRGRQQGVSLYRCTMAVIDVALPDVVKPLGVASEITVDPVLNAVKTV